MRAIYLNLLLVAMLVLWVSRPSTGAVVNYSISGGPNSLITGTLGTTSFTNATWRVSATADNSIIHEFTSNDGSYDIPIRVLPNTGLATLEIFEGGLVYTATLDPNPGFQYVVVTADFANDPMLAGSQGAGILHWDLGGNLEYGAGLLAGGNVGGTEGLFDSLTNLGSYSGGFCFFFEDEDIEFIPTSAGDLRITARFGDLQGGVWQAGVPEPSSMAIFGIATLGLAYRGGRRLKALKI
ncbi:MAG: PEP-CTERM sorting domain-containing protein [Planctomycetota bacterium]